jgi:hypothetical protein
MSYSALIIAVVMWLWPASGTVNVAPGLR